jgi:hypothetical protein
VSQAKSLACPRPARNIGLFHILAIKTNKMISKYQELQEKLKLHKKSFNEHQTWGHIGDLEHVKKEITEITNDFSFLYTD